MCKRMIRIQVQSQNGNKCLFERLFNYDGSVKVPFDTLVQSLDFMFSDVPHLIVFGVL